MVLGRQSSLGEPPKRLGVRRRAMIFSLAASILIWLLLSFSEDYYLSVEFRTCAYESQKLSPSCVTGLGEDSILAQPLPETIRATLYGPGISLLIQRFRARYWSSPITFNSDLGMLETNLLLRIPAEVSVENIIPERIDFRKEARIERLIPIESRVTFLSESPYFFSGAPLLDPDSVRISGPTSVINQLQSWPTNPDTLVRRGDSVNYQVDLADSLVGLVSLAVNQTTVTRYAPQYTEGQNERVRVEIEGIQNTNNAVQFDPESVTIIYQVPVSKFLETQQSRLIRAVVSYAQIYDDTTGHVEPRIEHPPELMLRQVTVSPNRLRYFINIGSQ